MKALLRRAWYAVFAKHPYVYLAALVMRARLGALVLRLTPAHRVEAVLAELYLGTPGLVPSLVRAAVHERYYALPEGERRAVNRTRYWGRYSTSWHESRVTLYTNDPERELLAARRPLLDRLESVLQHEPPGGTVCEIGAGNGIFLAQLARRFPAVERFVGLDLNPGVVAAATERFRDHGHLRFACAETVEWLTAEAPAAVVFVTCGTLVYFSEPELEELLRETRRRVPRLAFVIREIVVPHLNHAGRSRPMGAMAYSHDYPAVFTRCGFDVAAADVQAADVSRIERAILHHRRADITLVARPS